MEAHMATTARLQAIEWRFDVPPDLANEVNFHFELKIPLSISAAYGMGETTDLSLMFSVSDPDTPAVQTWVELTKSLSSSDAQMAANEWNMGRWKITAARFSGKSSGRLSCWFYVRSSSTGPSFYFGEPSGQFIRDAAGVVTTEGFDFLS